MKTRFIKKFGLLFGLALALISCNPDDSDNHYVQPEIAFGLIANASPDAQELYFSADQNRINSTPLQYGYAQGYFNFELGNRVLKVTNNAGVTLATKSITLGQSQIFSAFAINNPSNLQIEVYTDSLVNPAQGKARIRFINLTQDVPTIQITNTSGYNELLDYKEAGTFFDITPGTNFTITPENATDPAIQINTSAFNMGNIYTIFTKGFVDRTASQGYRFDYSVIRNY